MRQTRPGKSPHASCHCFPLLFCLVLGLVGAPAWAGRACDVLSRFSTSTATVTTAEEVSSGVFMPPDGQPLTGLPPFCRVTAVLHPSPDSAIQVELWMPQTRWNGRLEGTGNGGFAGHISYGALAAGVQQGYATVNTDMGMTIPPGQDATVFVNRPERWKDWGFRSTHDMTVQAKRLVTAFYQQPPVHSYFVGCSTGGEQAWMEAQRYPDDYDGIVGGAPANHRTGVHTSILWNFVTTERTPQDRLPTSKLSSLAQAVMTACDRLDGVVDGIIEDPSACSFDPASLACSGSENDHCLTPSQVAVVRRLYAGPQNPRTGKQLYPGLPTGSELGWSHLGPGANGKPPFAPIFNWVFGLDWNWREFDFDRSVAAFNEKLGTLVNATSPNLDTFRKHGHKLLIYHGWSDWLVVPGASIQDYQAMVSRYSPQTLNRFYRLFLVPGMTHCSGGVGPDHFDALSAMVSWVEQGQAPDRLLASQETDTQGKKSTWRTRPLCPYPQVARYSGSGNTNEAAYFSCVTPHP